MTMTKMKCPMTMTDEMPYENDKDEMPYDNDKDEIPYDSNDNQMPYEYDNDNDTAITEVKNDRNMTNDELKDVGIKDVVPYKRDDNMTTKVKRPIETSDVDNDFMREYDSMRKSMEDRQINDFYEALRHIQSAMKGDTLIKIGQIDNVLIILRIMIESIIEYLSQCAID